MFDSIPLNYNFTVHFTLKIIYLYACQLVLQPIGLNLAMPSDNDMSLTNVSKVVQNLVTIKTDSSEIN